MEGGEKEYKRDADTVSYDADEGRLQTSSCTVKKTLDHNLRHHKELKTAHDTQVASAFGIGLHLGYNECEKLLVLLWGECVPNIRRPC